MQPLAPGSLLVSSLERGLLDHKIALQRGPRARSGCSASDQAEIGL